MSLQILFSFTLSCILAFLLLQTHVRRKATHHAGTTWTTATTVRSSFPTRFPPTI
ncbi:hypothetical protein P691DRAFT_805355 [Macrolepiota fuliginosa MF-IS2]|uniref:ATP synthase F0 subunit 8 n=1 Tax=Macrolepiota fuliginosa MF-IS2 TaxID=1400762 RepID=A0A9P5XIR4_9AGAR|nr:hypothetical protein P691DRAFT_805355 [Macrolepiota fuliginosa MF-IS2]